MGILHAVMQYKQGCAHRITNNTMKTHISSKACGLFTLLISLAFLGMVSYTTFANSAQTMVFLPLLQERSAYNSDKIVFMSSLNDWFSLYTINPDGTEQRQVRGYNADTGAIPLTFLWSPDHTQIAVNTSGNDGMNTILVDPVTAEQTPLTNGGLNLAGDWSAESGLVMSVCNPELGNGIITMIPNEQPSGVLSYNKTLWDCDQLTSGSLLNFVLRRPQYMPDGETIFAFSEIINRNGETDPVNLTQLSDSAPYQAGFAYGIAPDGTIYFGVNDETAAEQPAGVLLQLDRENNQWIETLRLDGTVRIETLVPSPNGSHIGFTVSENELNISSGTYDKMLYVLNVADGAVRSLTPDFEATASFDWSPDSQKIAIGITDENGTVSDKGDLFVIDVQTGERTKISNIEPTAIHWAD